MYPRVFFDAFPAFPASHTVFVAMSFDSRFRERWDSVLRPAIEVVKIDDRPLAPLRVDMRSISNSILTEILDGISRAQVVVADVSTIGYLDGRPVRNANVMYEVGIAHSVRLPEEVLLFRSDNDPLVFDIANVRVNQYAPDDDPVTSRAKVTDCVVDAIRETRLQRLAVVRQRAQMLDCPCWSALAEASAPGGLKHPVVRTFGNVLSNSARLGAISRLLDLGLVRTSYNAIMPDSAPKLLDGPIENLFAYSTTALGIEVLKLAACELGMDSPDVYGSLGVDIRTDPH